MSARNKIRMYVEELFLPAPKSHRTIELKEELIANLHDRYDDLVSNGNSEEFAYDLVISGIGDVSELIHSLQDKYVLDPDAMERQRKKSALTISISIGLYILSVIPIIVLSVYGRPIAGLTIMLVMVAAATSLLIYNSISKPKHEKEQDNMVEDFKEWSSERKLNKAARKSIDSIIWLVATAIFLFGTMFLRRAGSFWMIFILAAIVQKIVNLSFSYTKDNNEEEL